MGLASLWKKIKESPTFRPSHFSIPLDHIDDPKGLGILIENDKHYFLVRMNEMFLTYKRRWVKDFEPVVFCSVDFNYAGEKVTQPFLLSPNSLQSPFKKYPEGMMFKEIKMAGLHPFKGGTFGISVVLGRMEMKNYLRKFLKFLESTASAFPGGFSSVLSSYVKMTNIILDGVEELFDTQEIEPIIGYRREFITDVQDDFRTGFYVLMNSDSADLDPKRFFVKDRSLHYGDSMATAKPFVSDDYVLYSVEATPERNDSNTLAFHKQFIDLQNQLSRISGIITEDHKKALSALLFSLNDAIWVSPDLVLEQKRALQQFYRQDIVAMIGNRQSLSGAKPLQETETNSLESQRFQSGLDILKLDF